MSMHELLAQHYGTGGVDSETLEKEAQVELFAKLASENGINLEMLTDEQVSQLWDATFNKEAGEGDAESDKDESPAHEAKESPKKEKEEAKKEAAAQEFNQRKEAMAKLAEADFLGRAMAHAMVNELSKIAEEQEASKADEEEDKKEEMKEEKKENPFAKKEASDLSSRLLAGAQEILNKQAQAPATTQSKQASAIDELAAQAAVVKAAQAGFNAEEAANRVSAVYTLGLNESTKVASAQDLDAAVDVRALEILEAAGYPVTWE